ncbi:MAG: NADH-quinone oxidoreductase subunit NuoK [Candidatus Eisenbacteria bacterium]|nr:NADH-quinone oxidoreductase subunit NuoK [Candidatus Eisenbacteria bacterium]
MPPETHLLAVSTVLFLIGCVGVLARRNLLVVLMAVEIMLNAANLAFAAFARARGAMDGQVVVFFVIAVAAAEAAVGLAIVVALYRKRGTVNIDRFTSLHQ